MYPNKTNFFCFKEFWPGTGIIELSSSRRIQLYSILPCLKKKFYDLPPDRLFRFGLWVVPFDSAWRGEFIPTENKFFWQTFVCWKFWTISHFLHVQEKYQLFFVLRNFACGGTGTIELSSSRWIQRYSILPCLKKKFCDRPPRTYFLDLGCEWVVAV